MSRIICLDAGHGYNTPGKRIPGGEREWSLNNKVCNYAEEMLKEYKDVSVVRTDDRTGERDIPLAERLSKARAQNPLVLVSVHHNAAGDGSTFHNATGVSTFVREGARADSIAIAKELAEKMSEYTGLRNRGGALVYNLYMNSISDFPTLVSEGGFMDGIEDSKIIVTAEAQQAYARALIDTFANQFNLEKIVVHNTIDYVVQRGDTFWALAQRYNTSVAAIQELNPTVQPRFLQIGSTIRIPRTTVTDAVDSMLKVGSKVRVKQNAKTYSGITLRPFVYHTVYDVIQINGDRVVIGIGNEVTAAMHRNDLILIS